MTRNRKKYTAKFKAKVVRHALREDMPISKHDVHSSVINRWKKAGIWDRIFDTIRDTYNYDLLMIDSTIANVHHAGSSVKKTVVSDAWADPKGINDQNSHVL